jgi:hypothetical protein
VVKGRQLAEVALEVFAQCVIVALVSVACVCVCVF